MKKKCVLALLMSVTLVMQMPMAVFAEGEGEAAGISGSELLELPGTEQTLDGIPAVAFGDGEIVNVTGDVTSSGTDSPGVGASGDSQITVTGNVTTSGQGSVGVVAEGNSVITVTGNITTTGENITGSENPDDDRYANGIQAWAGGTVEVKGDVTSSNAPAIEEADSQVKVEGTVTTEAEDVPAISAVGGTVEVTGDVTGEVIAETSELSSSFVKVTGDVTVSDGVAIYENDSTVEIKGNISSGSSTEYTPVIEASGGSVTVVGTVTGASGIKTSEAEISVTGNIQATNGDGIYATNSAVTVKGNVSSDKTGIYTDNESTIISNGTVSTNGSDSTAIVIELTSMEGTTGQIVLDNVKASENGCVFGISNCGELEFADNEAILNSIPDVYVYQMITQEDNYLWTFLDEELTEEELSEEEPSEAIIKADELRELILKEKILYEIKQSLSNGAVSVVNNGEKVDYAKEDTKLTVTVTADSGYEVADVSGGKAKVVKNADGTYTIIVPRGGGVNISAVIRAIMKEQQEQAASNNVTVSAPAVVESRYAIAQKEIQKAIKDLPQNGVYEIESKEFISFNRKTFEAISKRPDVAINVIYRWNGKRYKVVIPAGYPVMDLLDENGYCGCLYLNAVFGSELLD